MWKCEQSGIVKKKKENYLKFIAQILEEKYLKSIKNTKQVFEFLICLVSLNSYKHPTNNIVRDR